MMHQEIIEILKVLAIEFVTFANIDHFNIMIIINVTRSDKKGLIAFSLF